MTDQELFDLYMLQSTNVRALGATLNSVSKDINFCIKKNDDFQVSLKTKILALIYSAWSEAQFLQITCTPSGFTFAEIDAIKAKKERNGIAKGWDLMLNFAMGKVGDETQQIGLRQRLEKLLELVAKYIEEPSIIRNKIAHGQWVHALNGKNTKENPQLTAELQSLDPVEVLKMVEVHKYLGFIVRDLVQSPKEGFDKNYTKNIEDLEKFEKETRDWNIVSKRAKLALKPIVRK
ncbi:hypothetical protein SKZ59_15030 [Janthinobacterium sp. GMG2]|uniref:hypothetical protein n=1 Tax=Janthinobacterium sp. GMG2 TaxID=3096606 RepID=UPI0029F5991F|nr:hypothetical protein [Janthinobacterium sp. GMG2]MDX8123095.1 hypothetical protein [Janthinobacterium sp. GMG2]